MTSSKFVEILDTCETPYSHDNVSLEDILAETRERSASASSASSASSDKSSDTPTSSITQPVKTRRRGFSLRKAKT